MRGYYIPDRLPCSSAGKSLSVLVARCLRSEGRPGNSQSGAQGARRELDPTTAVDNSDDVCNTVDAMSLLSFPSSTALTAALLAGFLLALFVAVELLLSKRWNPRLKVSTCTPCSLARLLVRLTRRALMCSIVLSPADLQAWVLLSPHSWPSGAHTSRLSLVTRRS